MSHIFAYNYRGEYRPPLSLFLTVYYLDLYYMRRFALFLCILLVATNALAQSTSLHGVVVDKERSAPLPGATVLLLHLPDSTKAGAVTRPNGTFAFRNLAQGRYELTVSYIGYHAFSRSVTIADNTVQLDTIQLRTNTIQTEEVQVVDKVPAALQKGDTTEFQARAFKTNPDASAEDLVTKLPGVVMQDGQVQAQGEQVQEVLVDGRPFFGNDPNAALRNLPAEIIDKIQVFDKQSDQAQFTGFNNGNERKTLNIITKPSARASRFGKFFAGYGHEGRYKAGGHLNIFNNDQRITLLTLSNNTNEQNFAAEDLLGALGSSGQRGGPQRWGGGRGRPPGSPGRGGNSQRWGSSDIDNFLIDQRDGIATTHAFGLNYSDVWDTKTEITGSYFFNRSNSGAETSVFRQYTNANQSYTETGNSSIQNTNHRINMRIDQEIDSLSSLVIRPVLSVQFNNGTNALDGGFALNNRQYSRTGSDNGSDLTGLALSGSILYKRKFALKGRTLSLEIEPEYTSNAGNSSLLFGSASRTAPQDADSLEQSSDLDANGWSVASNITYTEPIGEQGQGELSYALTRSRNTSDKQTYGYNPATEQDRTLDTTLSNVFSNDYTKQEVEASYRYKNEAFSFNIGTAYEWAQLQGVQTFPVSDTIQQNFYSVLPTAMVRYDFSDDANIRLVYRTSTTPPTATQLQSVINNTNPLQLTTGNPNLLQSYQHRFFMRYRLASPLQSTSLFTMIAGSFTNNSISNNTIFATRDTVLNNGILLPQGSQLTYPVNIDGQFSLRTFTTYGFPVEPLKSNLNLSLSGTYTRTPSFANGVLNYAYSPTVGVGVVLSSNISENLDFTFSSNTSLTDVQNSVRKTLDTRYYNQNTGVKLNWIFGGDFVFNTELNHQWYDGLSESVKNNTVLWNVGFGKKFFENKQGELRLSVFDILGQNTNVQRNVTESYIEDIQTTVLQRYVMLTFTYSLRSSML